MESLFKNFVFLVESKSFPVSCSSFPPFFKFFISFSFSEVSFQPFFIDFFGLACILQTILIIIKLHPRLSSISIVSCFLWVLFNSFCIFFNGLVITFLSKEFITFIFKIFSLFFIKNLSTILLNILGFNMSLITINCFFG